MNKFIYALMAIALLSCARTPSYQEARASGDEMRFSIESLEDSAPVFYSLEHEGIRINYFVLRIKGRVESYFDACAKCYPKKLGFKVAGDRLVCVACGKRYRLDELGGIGSCYPIPLAGRVEGEDYVIEKADIIKGTKYF